MLYLILGFFFNSTLIAHANEPSGKRIISGKVVDKISGESLSGVKIQVKGTDTFCYTDLNGNYLMYVEPTKITQLCVEIVGYAPLNVSTTEAALNPDLQLIPW